MNNMKIYAQWEDIQIMSKLNSFPVLLWMTGTDLSHWDECQHGGPAIVYRMEVEVDGDVFQIQEGALARGRFVLF